MGLSENRVPQEIDGWSMLIITFHIHMPDTPIYYTILYVQIQSYSYVDNIYNICMTSSHHTSPCHHNLHYPSFNPFPNVCHQISRGCFGLGKSWFAGRTNFPPRCWWWMGRSRRYSWEHLAAWNKHCDWKIWRAGVPQIERNDSCTGIFGDNF
jgi:hypothetical protein